MLKDTDITPFQGEILWLLQAIYDERCYSFKIPHSASNEEKAVKRLELDTLNKLENSNMIVMKGFVVNTVDYELAYNDIVILSAGVAYLKQHGGLKEMPAMLGHDIQPVDTPSVPVSDQDAEIAIKHDAIEPAQDKSAHTALPEQVEAMSNGDQSAQRLNIPKFITYLRKKHCLITWINALPLMIFACFWISYGYESKDLMTKAFGSILLMTTGASAMFSLFEIVLWEKRLLRDDGKKIKAEFLQDEKPKS